MTTKTDKGLIRFSVGIYQNEHTKSLPNLAASHSGCLRATSDSGLELRAYHDSFYDWVGTNTVDVQTTPHIVEVFIEGDWELLESSQRLKDSLKYYIEVWLAEQAAKLGNPANKPASK